MPIFAGINLLQTSEILYTMWKEKLGNYLIDVSKYFLTGVFVASLIKDLEDMRWLIYALSGTIAAALLVLGLILTNNKDKK